jgi:hypothetical protein
VLRTTQGIRIGAVRDGSQPIRVQPFNETMSRLSVKAGHVYTIAFERSPAPPKSAGQ